MLWHDVEAAIFSFGIAGSTGWGTIPDEAKKTGESATAVEPSVIVTVHLNRRSGSREEVVASAPPTPLAPHSAEE
jgi:hypothetical protein